MNLAWKQYYVVLTRTAIAVPGGVTLSDATITRIKVRDCRYDLEGGAGSDSVHTNPQYAYAVCLLETDSQLTGSGLTFTLEAGNDLVCKAIEYLAGGLVGRSIEELMSDYGTVFREMADSPCLRWLGPHKGVVHLALASITNACFDLWAKVRGVPLWKLLLDLPPEELLNTIDFRYIEDAMTRQDALAILTQAQATRDDRMGILKEGYTGYDTSVGWFNYPDEMVKENAKRALEQGFQAMKLKVGSRDPERDIRRAMLIREVVGDGIKIMLDANQQWTLPQALDLISQLRPMHPYWVEEPTHPDDVLAHQTLARAVYPIKIALGEHVPNKVIFKNFLQARAMSINQVDATRVGGVSEFIAISLLSKQFGIPVIPHVGDMGQLHQHLVLFNHVGIGHEALFLEYIPHLAKYFVDPVQMIDGKYKVPENPGSSCDLKDEVG